MSTTRGGYHSVLARAENIVKGPISSAPYKIYNIVFNGNAVGDHSGGSRLDVITGTPAEVVGRSGALH